MKRIVICSDGTWNTPDKTENGRECVTNVVKMTRAVLPVAPDGTPQVVFYDEGVGTGVGLIDRFVGGATGLGLDKNVLDAYRFLMNNWEPGDEIWFFGFSRGAYTVRSAAGLVRKCGLLRKDQAHRVREAYDLYRSEHMPDSEEATSFRARHSREVDRIHFLGVWDTVGALGIPVSGLRRVFGRRRQFHDVQLSRMVRHAYHAVSIDERRSAYEPSLWTRSEGSDQVVEQAWFPGVHSDVGGGYPSCGLSDVTFLWMKERAQRAGLAFDDRYVKEAIQPDPLGELHESRKGIWGWIPASWRVIGDPRYAGQSVDGSALIRRADPKLGYAPPNLEAYLKERR